MNSAVVWEGPSLLTGAPIAVVVTGLQQASANTKTGPMVQAWILRADQSPTEAVKTGGDTAICGDCRHRSGTNLGRSCYVVWWLGPQQIYRALSSYPRQAPRALTRALATRYIRFGAYGDPAAAPTTVWQELASVSRGWTGYTHHWRTCDPALRLVCMASTDSLDEKQQAHARGWRTFRVRGSAAEALSDDEVICPASAEAHHSAVCADCRLCGGQSRDARSVAILPHGQRVKWLGSRS